MAPSGAALGGLSSRGAGLAQQAAGSSASDDGVAWLNTVLAANWAGWLAVWLSSLLRGVLGDALRRGRPMFLDSVELVSLALDDAAPRLGAPQECPARPPDARRAVLHVSPHSHDDVGWHSTFMQYFLGTGSSCPCNVSQIIGAVVESLASSPERRFSLAEQASFTTWF